MKKKIILLLLLVVVLPISAKAATLEMSCASSTINVGDSVRCVITGKDSMVSGGSGKVSVSNGSITNREKIHCAAPSITDEFSCYDEMVENKIDIVAYTFKSSSAGTMTITVSDATVVDANFDQVSVSNITKKITVKQPTTTTTTKATTRQTQAPQVQPSNTQPQTQGTTESPVTEETTQATEETTVPETNAKTDSDTQLSSLSIKDVVFTFQSDKYEYNIELTSDITDLVLDYKTYNANAEVTVSSTKLVMGMNNIEIKVTYAGETSTYKLNINKKAKKDNKREIIRIAKLVGSVVGMIGLSYVLIIVIKK